MPIKYLLTTTLLFASLHATHKPFTLMLEPAGNSKYTGREIDDCFERGITLQYAEKLKKLLISHYPTIKVLLSRQPGEHIEPLQNAHFANRIGVDFYISIHFYQEPEEKPKFFLYQFSYDKITDFWDQPLQPLQFLTYDQAHRAYTKISKAYGEIILNTLHKEYPHQFDIKQLFTLPFKPLIGINAPALGLEIGVQKKNDWELFLNPLLQSLKNIIEQELKAYRS